MFTLIKLFLFRSILVHQCIDALQCPNFNLQEASSVDPEEFLRKAMNLSAVHSPTNHKSRSIRLMLMNIMTGMVAMAEELDDLYPWIRDADRYRRSVFSLILKTQNYLSPFLRVKSMILKVGQLWRRRLLLIRRWSWHLQLPRLPHHPPLLAQQPPAGVHQQPRCHHHQPHIVSLFLNSCTHHYTIYSASSSSPSIQECYAEHHAEWATDLCVPGKHFDQTVSSNSSDWYILFVRLFCSFSWASTTLQLLSLTTLTTTTTITITTTTITTITITTTTTTIMAACSTDLSVPDWMTRIWGRLRQKYLSTYFSQQLVIYDAKAFKRRRRNRKSCISIHLVNQSFPQTGNMICLWYKQ